jgi:hypothetical protein
MYRGDIEIAQRALHQRYGPLVRIAPNELVTSDPAAISLIYRTQNPLSKTDWYVTFRPEGMREKTPSNHYMTQGADTLYPLKVSVSMPISSPRPTKKSTNGIEKSFSQRTR